MRFFIDFRHNNSLRWNIMDTYIVLKFIGSVFYSIALLMTIVVVFDISEKIHKFIENDIPLNVIIFQYYFNFIPYFVNLFFPLFTFISVIFFTSKLSGNNEIISFFNGGISFYRFLVPYLAGAAILSILSLFMANIFIPYTNHKMYMFTANYMQKKILTSSDIRFKADDSTYVYVRRWRDKISEGENFTLENIAQNRMKKKLCAELIRYNDTTKSWHLEQYIKRSFTEDDNEVIQIGASLDTNFSFNADDFNDDETIMETMSYIQLRHFIEKEKKKGSSLVKIYEIEKHKRIANPLSIFIMTLLGVSVAARKSRRGIGVHIFIGLFFVFMFIFFQQVSTVFAISEQLSPAMATWLPNLVYLGICIILLRNTPK